MSNPAATIGDLPQDPAELAAARVALPRRRFLLGGLGGASAWALSSLLDQDGIAAGANEPGRVPLDPLEPRRPHFAPRVKRIIYIYLEGGPSQMDLFDPKPELNRLDGQPLPESMLAQVRFAFIQKESARLMGTPRTFRRYGECGIEMSDLLPHLGACADDLCLIRSMHTDQFNHLPGQLLMNTGSAIAGRPSLGSWLAYGLGSESRDLPAFVSLVTVGRGIPGGAASWSSGFLPSTYAGTQFRSDGDPVLNLGNPPGIDAKAQESSIAAINDLNRIHDRSMRDSELVSRIRAYELAFRMQTAAPELTDLSDETQETLDLYGLNREEPPIKSNLGGVGLFGPFARNCLLARRLVERGVRVVGIFHSSWDHHSSLEPQLKHNCLMADQPIAALLRDLKRRGLWQDTLIVWNSEFGRTPLGENRTGANSRVTGRDHHPYAFSIWLAGGGVRGGQVIGRTDDIAWGVVEDAVHVHDLQATILHLCGLDHTRLTYLFQGR
ncbi:MAG: DUF1501 domain-containing protein, partial [Pirellulaceae bacterium]